MAEWTPRPPNGPNDHPDLDDTVAAYVLGALPDKERRAFERELTRNPEARRRLAEWGAVAAALPLAVDEVEPPARLRGRILDAARADASAANGSAPAPAPSTPAELPQPQPACRATAPDSTVGAGQVVSSPVPIRPQFASAPAWAALAALLLLCLGLGWSTLTTRGELAAIERDRSALAQSSAEARQQVALLEQQLQQAQGQLRQAQGDLVALRSEVEATRQRLNEALGAVSAREAALDALVTGPAYRLEPTEASPRAQGWVALPPGRQAVLIARDLPPLGPDQVYQAWVIKDGPPIPAGVFGAAEATGETPVPIAADVSGAQRIAITIEPGPAGSQTPTLPVVGRATLGGAS